MHTDIKNKINKAEAFDLLAEHFYSHNFGSKTKSEIDLLMFKILTQLFAMPQRLTEAGMKINFRIINWESILAFLPQESGRFA